MSMLILVCDHCSFCVASCSRCVDDCEQIVLTHWICRTRLFIAAQLVPRHPIDAFLFELLRVLLLRHTVHNDHVCDGEMLDELR